MALAVLASDILKVRKRGGAGGAGLGYIERSEARRRWRCWPRNGQRSIGHALAGSWGQRLAQLPPYTAPSTLTATAVL